MKKVYLIILDGFGIGKKNDCDAIFHSKKPFIDSLMDQYPMSKLKTYGSAVGLPEFQTGGSEAGHLTIGAGRPVKQFLTEINDDIESGEFFKNPVLIELFEKAKQKGRIHLLGMTSDGGIHSFQPHLYGLLQMAEKFGIPNDKIFIHAFLDGRDVGDRSAEEYLKEIDKKNIGKIASIGGRYFGMDRDKNWDRIDIHFKILTDSSTKASSKTWQENLNNHYENTTKSDYYVPPILLNQDGQIQADDVVIFWNFRVDRGLQISERLSNFITPENFGIFGPYCDSAQLVFADEGGKIPNTLGEILAKNNLAQLRVSETEKFNHVTFYFSGLRKKEFEGENRILIPSKKCESYAEKPEMSAYEQVDAISEEIKKHDYPFVVQNFANPDLVGHSGSFEAVITAIETLDKCMEKLIPKLLEHDYEIIMTADHGNADCMTRSDGKPNSSHTKADVPCVLISNNLNDRKLKETGGLADLAPTVLDVLDIEKPTEMTGQSLII